MRTKNLLRSEEWLASVDAAALKEALWKHWRQCVPLAYSSSINADVAKEERRARKLLIRPLEIYLCDGDPESVFQKLQEKGTPPQLCGRGFKVGEPTYSCRDCGMDGTCVLCIDCFKNSEHRKHRYRMSTSGGGGYCDCGDPEAWKSEPFCDIHKKGLEQQQEEQNPITLLSAGLRQRAELLFVVVLEYIIQILTWESCELLPEGLQVDKLQNSYVTMLFNDEVHTYDQVIQTLQKAIDCSQKEAVEFATTVDREGRSIVRNGSFTECEKARSIVEKNTSRLGSKPLKVQVMHNSIVSHQTFAQKLLPWLQQVTNYADGLRHLFCQVAMRKESEESESLIERLLLADTKLWKSARIQSHQLCMSGILKDQSTKKEFAIIFTKLYPRLVRDFITDDHDHSVCACSESVQIFTVPTLARLLITEHNLLQVIMDTFLAECKSKINAKGKLCFERNDSSHSFRRAQYMLYDLKYCLTFMPTPSEWCQELRVNFLNGYKAVLKLLKYMEGMDAVTRQTGQHIEYEPEWEGAFNVQLKLSDNLALLQSWCYSDREVLVEGFHETVAAINDVHLGEKPLITVKLAGHEALCIKYSVASQPVSIHLPVTRMLAGLYLQINRLGLPLVELHKECKANPADIMEPALRTLVMTAQSQAGMWRRNGYSLLNQIYFYHNVRCREEMFDKDIILLQVAAALLDSNKFLIHLIYKFNLHHWAKESYDVPKEGPQEDLVRQTVTVAEEFLSLLVIVLSERSVPGVGQVSAHDKVKKEIIHLLCIHPMAHSELAKSLPDDPNDETGIEDVVHDIATFKKPSGPGKGVYELKPEFYKEYNPYFYHYTKGDQSKSEEAQRKRKKAAKEDQALPPPVPPPFHPGLAPTVNLLQCDVMLHLMQLVLKRMAATRSRSRSEAQFDKVLHLIGLALHEEERAHEAGNGSSFCFTEKASKGEMSIIGLLESLVDLPSITHESQKDLLSWVIKKFAQVKQGRTGSDAMDTVSLATCSASEKAAEERKLKSQLAAQRRARIMAQMSAMQKNFIRENAELFENTSTELERVDSDMDISQPVEPMSEYPVVVGGDRSAASTFGTIRETCILCQEEQDVRHNERAMVLAAFVQKSTVLSRSRGRTVDNPDEYDPLFMPQNLIMGPHTSTCGHVMHADCWDRYFRAILEKESHRPLLFRQHLSYDVDKMEFLCPLCETLSNTVIPIIPHLSTLIKESEKKQVVLSLNDWLDGIQKTVKHSIQEAKDKESQEESYLFVPCPLSSITKMMAESVAKNFQTLFDYVYDDDSAHFSDSITEMLRKFSRDVYTVGLGVHPDDENTRVPVMSWMSTAYTIMATEHSLRDEGKPLFGALSSRQSDCLTNLVKFAAVCSQVIQSDVVKRHCVNLLSALVLRPEDRRLQETPCLLDMDMFHQLVSLCLSLPTLYADDNASKSQLTRVPTGDLNDLHMLRFVLTAHLVQILLTAKFDAQAEEMEIEMDTDDCTGEGEGQQLLKKYIDLRTRAGLKDAHIPTAWQLLQYVKTACLPFLRASAMFFHYLTGVRAPAELEDTLGVEEFELLCRYLSVPVQLSQLMTDSGSLVTQLIRGWCSDPVLKLRLIQADGSKVIRYPLAVNRLIPLPEDYSQLINDVSIFTCPNSDGDESRAPTMCLVCGDVLCSQSYCCQTELHGSVVGAVTAHTHKCGAGIGIFLRVRDSQILFLSGTSRGCFYTPPYIDDYGETDQGLRRGNPLHLCKEQYEKIQKIWHNHSVPEEIVHALEANTNLLSVEWQHL